MIIDNRQSTVTGLWEDRRFFILNVRVGHDHPKQELNAFLASFLLGNLLVRVSEPVVFTFSFLFLKYRKS